MWLLRASLFLADFPQRWQFCSTLKWVSTCLSRSRLSFPVLWHTIQDQTFSPFSSTIWLTDREIWASNSANKSLYMSVVTGNCLRTKTTDQHYCWAATSPSCGFSGGLLGFLETWRFFRKSYTQFEGCPNDEPQYDLSNWWTLWMFSRTANIPTQKYCQHLSFSSWRTWQGPQCLEQTRR